MNQPLMERLIRSANEDDFIKIDYGNKDIVIKKRFLKYAFYNKGYHLEIVDNCKNEVYLFKTDSIDVVTLIKPKFKGMTWWSQGENKEKIDAGI